MNVMLLKKPTALLNLTILVGPNSAGKSALERASKYIREDVSFRQETTLSW